MKYKKIRFPRENLPHEAIVEWWYYNGHLKDRNGNEYAFMNCLFKVDPKRINLPFIKNVPLKNYFFSHHLLSDITKKKFYSKIHPILIISKDSFTKDLLFVNYISPSLNGYVNYEIQEISKFKFRIKTDFFDLILKSKKRPLLAGGKGFLNQKTENENYYYSFTDLETRGTINLDGKQIKVKGKSWMDHQWADTPYEKVMWNWFSIQLKNQTEIMCYEFKRKEKKIYLANIIKKNSSCEFLKDLTITPKKKTWKSDKTGARYPLSWNIIIPSKKIYLTASPLIKNQEMIFGSINYWEGPIEIKGKINKKNVKGQGFMELVGYEMKKSIITQYNEEIKKKILSKTKQLKKKIKFKI